MSDELFSLRDRVAVVTGGEGQLGGEIVRALEERGARVAAFDLQNERFRVDVTDRAAVDAATEEVVREWGTPHVLVNAAALDSPPDAPAEEVGPVESYPESSFDEVMNVNVKGTLLCCQAIGSRMAAEGRGSIVNVSSVEGLRGYPPGIIYGAYKAAVVQLTRSLGVQLGSAGVRVNGIGPDVTDSIQVPYDRIVPPEHQHLWPQWVPVGRMGVPRDQARIILFLASDLSAFMTGHTIPTDGGTAAAGGWFRSAQRAGGRAWTNRPIAP